LNVDVLLLCETWLKQRHSDSMFLSMHVRLDHRYQVGGGLLCFTFSSAYGSCLYKFDSTRTSCLMPKSKRAKWFTHTVSMGQECRSGTSPVNKATRVKGVIMLLALHY